MEKSNLIVIFWFYKKLDLCLERIKHFKSLNPNVSIYGLYGGEDIDVNLLEDINKELEHLYLFNRKKSSHWKWMNGDQMLVEWFREVGHKFDWANVFILQWDLVMFKPLAYFIEGIQERQYALSSVRKIEDVEDWWPWFEPEKINEFKLYLEEKFEFEGGLNCCLFIFALLPREFFDYFKNDELPEKYFLEYKIPSILAALNYMPFKSRRIDAFWYDEPTTKFERIENRNMLAVGHGIPSVILKSNLIKNNHMIFHPYYMSLSGLNVENVKFGFMDAVLLAKLNIASYFKFIIKKLIKYNRKKRSGLLKIIK